MKILEPIWLHKSAGSSDVVFMSSINIFRNVEGQKFVEHSTSEENSILGSMLCDFVEKDTSDAFDIAEKYCLPDLEKSELKILQERYLLPKKIFKYENSYLYTAENEKKSILINGNEHISIRVSSSTADVFSLYNSIESIEHIFERSVGFAFNDEFGYLTSSLKNTGCAFVGSAILCIPMLSYFDKNYLDNFYRECFDLGFVVLNEKGQRATNCDNFVHVKNRYSFGMSEHDILHTLGYIINTFVQKELELRENLAPQYKTVIEDKIFRSYNTLKSARLIGYKEAKNALLWLRVANFYNMFGINIDTINKMLVFLKNGHLDNFNTDNTSNYNEMRANYISMFLQ